MELMTKQQVQQIINNQYKYNYSKITIGHIDSLYGVKSYYPKIDVSYMNDNTKFDLAQLDNHNSLHYLFYNQTNDVNLILGVVNLNYLLSYSRFCVNNTKVLVTLSQPKFDNLNSHFCRKLISDCLDLTKNNKFKINVPSSIKKNIDKYLVLM